MCFEFVSLFGFVPFLAFVLRNDFIIPIFPPCLPIDGICTYSYIFVLFNFPFCNRRQLCLETTVYSYLIDGFLFSATHCNALQHIVQICVRVHFPFLQSAASVLCDVVLLLFDFLGPCCLFLMTVSVLANEVRFLFNFLVPFVYSQFRELSLYFFY